MRFWITRNSELPIREQLVRQVLLGILSEDLPAGHKLPSVRAIARRHHIHSNTVSAAFHDLLEQGWLELRRGSGLYVRPLNPSGAPQGDLDRLLAKLLQEALGSGYQPDVVLDRLTHLLHPRTYQRILVAEPSRPCVRFFKPSLASISPSPSSSSSCPIVPTPLSSARAWWSRCRLVRRKYVEICRRELLHSAAAALRDRVTRGANKAAAKHDPLHRFEIGRDPSLGASHADCCGHRSRVPAGSGCCNRRLGESLEPDWPGSHGCHCRATTAAGLPCPGV